MAVVAIAVDESNVVEEAEFACKVTKSREQNKETCFFFAEWK